MRTPDQIKRKLNELLSQKQTLENRLGDTSDSAGNPALAAMIERIEDQILLLEWVLNEPIGKYHA